MRSQYLFNFVLMCRNEVYINMLGVLKYASYCYLYINFFFKNTGHVLVIVSFFVN
jgi:hypothetical protein